MTKELLQQADETDKAREYILFSIDRLYTYENYVKTKLAGDFAYEIAKALKAQEEKIKALADELKVAKIEIGMLERDIKKAGYMKRSK